MNRISILEYYVYVNKFLQQFSLLLLLKQLNNNRHWRVFIRIVMNHGCLSICGFDYILLNVLLNDRKLCVTCIKHYFLKFNCICLLKCNLFTFGPRVSFSIF